MKAQAQAIDGVDDDAEEGGTAAPDTASRRYQTRQNMLAKLPKRGVCAEIGVWTGQFSIQILEVTEPTELVLIDPWDMISAQPDADRSNDKHADAQFMKDMYQSIVDLYGALPQVKIIKGLSEPVLSTFPDGYFDWVYIDGNHLFDFVLKDIQIAYDKVKKGGVIVGDDLFWKKNGRQHVREAVFACLKFWGDKVRFEKVGAQFMIYKL